MLAERRFAVLIGIFCGAMVLVADSGRRREAAAIEFPHARPGPAQARVDGETIVLENTALSAKWSIVSDRLQFSHLVNHLESQTISGTGPLVLATLTDGREISLHLAGKPRAERIAARPEAGRLAERFAVWQVTAPLVSSDGSLTAEWEASLRDDSNAVRQQITLRAATAAVPIRDLAIAPQEAPVAATSGSVEGSPVVTDTFFFACEHPMANNRVENGRVYCGLTRAEPIQAGESWTVPAVMGVAPKGQLRRAFLYYVDRGRPRPYRPCLHYNSWFDIAWKDRKMDEATCLARIEQFGRELTEKRGISLDAFVFDDGWDDNRTLWRFLPQFPRGFTPLEEAAGRYGSGLGVWLSPWGGYSEAKAQRLKYGATQGFETNRHGFTLAGPKYYQRFREVCLEMMDKYGVRYFKFDGLGPGNDARGAADYVRDVEALLRLIRELREKNPQLFVNVTVGTWPSPFWLWHSDAVWRGGRDVGHDGPGSLRRQWLTYRDGVAYRQTVLRAPLFPLNSLKSQGFCFAQLGTDYTKMGYDEDEAIEELHMLFASGTQQQDLFVTPDLMTPRLWDALAESAAWCRANRDVLVDSHWIGGDPGEGEVYGYASWSPDKGVLVVRNPTDKTIGYALDVATAFELPAAAATRYRLQCPWRESRARIDAVATAGEPTNLQLAPFEALVLEATSLSAEAR
ncbi:MAG: enterotoxin [Rhodopirellula sp.]|nr:enterotoxin [Rhodopirellula sp.]